MNEIILMKNQEAVAYYMRETGYGVRYGILVKTTSLYTGDTKYGFVTTSGQVTKEYKTQRSMSKWATDREWQVIKTDYHKNECLKITKNL